ncbi:MAG: T9SS type A sorting domain-containing protein [Bacteroidetes bacterium]|nr:T9SS type A sorting domain-containing protein [Bacteroidota bacterium]
MNKIILFLLFFCLFTGVSRATCPAGQIEVKVVLTTDNYPSETSWQLTDKLGNVLMTDPGSMAQATTYTSTVCTPSTTCLKFTINDAYGDGICCGYGNGHFVIYVNGVVVINHNGQFSNTYVTNFNCGPGESCATAFSATTGTYTAPGQEYYYKFKPAQLGIYNITMCGLTNSCDTKLWIYDNCSAPKTSNNTGTIFYNDDFCGTLSQITGALDTAKTYYIRVGASSATCTAAINFAINYQGPVTGCTSPTACNYNPLASVDDGSCKYYPDPTCPGPDLTIDQPRFQSSMYLGTVTAPAGDCRVVEGCLNGYGTRTVINFDTYIKNIGTMDYYIGNPSSHPGQFTFNNCHGHAHYEGYAEYRLYKQNGQLIPIGFKNGFCVLDFDGCPGGGIAKYSCSNMGITNGCGDIYSAGLDCQWVDITDVDTGQYVLATKVNWDQSPDALGNYELTYTNNWAQVCLRITQNSAGQKNYVLLPNCLPYQDCMGVQYGNATIDCNGTCNGTAKMGDLNNNGLQQNTDAQLYVSNILNSSIAPNACNDLNNTNSITVWDAALMVNCAMHGAPNNTKCVFPRGVVNPNYTATFSIGNFNSSQNYFDVYVTNPTAKILGYEFTISGATILNAVNLVPATQYPENPDFNAGGTKVICLSYKDSTIGKSNTPQPLCRIYYANATSQVCINQVVEVVDKDYEAIMKALVNNCVITTGVAQVIDAENYFSVVPNPATDHIDLTGHFKDGKHARIQIRDMSGRLIFEEQAELDNMFTYPVDVSDLKNGVYIVTLTTASGRANKPIVITK